MISRAFLESVLAALGFVHGSLVAKRWFEPRCRVIGFVVSREPIIKPGGAPWGMVEIKGCCQFDATEGRREAFQQWVQERFPIPHGWERLHSIVWRDDTLPNDRWSFSVLDAEQAKRDAWIGERIRKAAEALAAP